MGFSSVPPGAPVRAFFPRSEDKTSKCKTRPRSIALPPKVAKQVETIAKQRALSEDQVLVELLEQGIAASQRKEKVFFQLAERFRAASDPEQVKQLGDGLGRFVFGG